MAKLQKFISQVDYLWYHAEITDEQATEYKAYLAAEEAGEDIDEPDWLWDLDYDLVRDKPGSDDTTYELIED
jgi:hypothetical protein|tara:strand:+ start:1144 stop:1359 length:216 start_codon:yes stop_codon:yes gene_type:complete